MRLYNIVVNNNFSGEEFSFQKVGNNIDTDTAFELAKEYLITECGYSPYDVIDSADFDVVECYEIDEVDGYKVKLVKG